ncbi:hypothetical protein BYT27DRAFT_7226801 [Phlegmacium glaucopus]|nr:hypothetical protein BYT27DRAFT_7226801 [Phlegmacium glaucopus]
MSQHGEASTSSATLSSVTPSSTAESSGLQTEAVNACINIVQQFRAGKVSKPKVSLLLQQAIPHKSVEEESFVSAYGSYLDMLDNFERYRTGNIQRIDATSRALAGEGSNEQQQADGRPDTKTESLENLSPSLQKTHALLENFSRDVKWARSSLLNCNQAVPQFPQAEWLNLLSGNIVGLNHVFSNIYTISYSNKESVELGKNIEVLHSPSTPARTVKTHGDWVITWDALAEATCFIFSHRKHELQLYSKHIQRYFTSLPAQYHSRVINYDRAVRIRISQRCDLKLSNFAQFDNLQIQWIHSPSNLSSSQQAEPRARQPYAHRRSAPCRRWNERRCPNSASTCNYLHVCSKCSSGGHVARECAPAPRK